MPWVASITTSPSRATQVRATQAGMGFMNLKPRSLSLLLLLTVCIAGCSWVPNMDHGSSGCQNARGIGPTRDDTITGDARLEEALPELVGLHPVEAAERARAAGHTVVFNVQIPGYGECWCVPPPEGKVVQTWWNDHGAIFLMVEGVDLGHTGDDQPAAGWGC
jgi:hypothetical protein